MKIILKLVQIAVPLLTYEELQPKSGLLDDCMLAELKHKAAL